MMSFHKNFIDIIIGKILSSISIFLSFARRYDPGISQILAESATIVAESQSDIRGDGALIQELNRRLEPHNQNRLSGWVRVQILANGWLIGW